MKKREDGEIREIDRERERERGREGGRDEELLRGHGSTLKGGAGESVVRTTTESTGSQSRAGLGCKMRDEREGQR